ncbi:DNA replication/repair protein RecF [Kordiimonas aquimaris]|uniref:DNA replication/repair protein RecF n=1 Tax=Kordiimonas aquimaris TaxID=707591 RepID=UPI0021D0B7C5|nr:DNA replication/repair protein RecF [Kordiimonas aquimaris]
MISTSISAHQESAAIPASVPDLQGHTRVSVSRVMLTNYRSYKTLSLKLQRSSNMVVLTGENGVGKTNILEAISYAAPGRGLRGAGLDDISRHNKDNWSVALQLALEQDDICEDIKVGTGIEASTTDADSTDKKPHSRRIVKIDGEIANNTNCLGERWSIGWLTPQMDRLFIEGPSSRRKFLDRLTMGLYPDHSRQIGAFERTMRERNRLLSDQGVHADAVWLSALEARMAEHGVAAAVARLEFAGQIAGQIEDAAETPFPKAMLAIDGWLEGLLADGLAPVEVEVQYRERLAHERVLDCRSGRTSTGIHKTDFIVTHKPKSMRADLCSTGEQKALLVGLIIANAHLQTALKRQAPLLLLDEVAAHLDNERRSALFDILGALGSQCWLTGTDMSLFESLKGKAEFFDVSDGKVQPSLQ